jgi:addiction module HigA family antidote
MIHNPKHPGQLVKSMCLEPLGLSVTEAAKVLKISRPTLSKLLNGHIGISPEMAIRLAIVFSTSDELWVNLQASYDLWQANKQRSKLHLKSIVQDHHVHL